MALNTTKEALMSGEGQVLVLDESFSTANKTSPTNEIYNLMIVFDESVVTFEAQWETTTGTLGDWVTFTDKILQPSNYPRKIKNVVLTSGFLILEK